MFVLISLPTCTQTYAILLNQCISPAIPHVLLMTLVMTYRDAAGYLARSSDVK